MKTALALAFILLAAPALAQSPAPQPTFEPFTVNEQDWKMLQGWLAEQPYKFTQPVLEWATALEQRAQAAKKADKSPAPKPD